MTTHTLQCPVTAVGTTCTHTDIAIFKTVKTWYSRAQQRQQLSQLTAEQLHDIGISPEAAAAETAKQFWQA